MELVFQEKEVECLQRVFCETVLSEQTADVIVPDAQADILRVVDAFGTVLIRSTDCAARSASVAGSVQVGAIYVGENGEVCRIRTQIPFAVRRDFSSQQENCTLQCKCVLRSVDARALNSRKMLVRVGLACTLTVYATEKRTLYDLPEAAENLQLKRTTLPLTVPLTLCEKSFVINDELEVDGTRPAVEKLLKCLCKTQVAEQKAVGDKAVFKGSLLIHALYEDGEGKLNTHDWTVPFSQYVQMEREADESELSTRLSLKSFEVEPDSTSDSRRLLLSCDVLAQCMAVGQEEFTLIEDAYCTDAVLTPEFASCELTAILDRQTFRQTAITGGGEAAQAVVDVSIYCDEADRQRTEEGILLTQPFSCNVLYYDAQGELQGTTLHPTVTVQTALNEEGSCCVTEVNEGEASCAVGSGGVELRLPVELTVESTASHRLKLVMGGEITALPEETEQRPSIILRRAEQNEELWELAKTYRTSVGSIREANALTADTIRPDTMLLIPLS